MLRKSLVYLLIVGASLLGFTGPALAEPVQDVQLQVLVFNDLDQSGLQDEGEPAIADIELILQSGELTLMVVTDETGLFSTPVQPGMWTISLPEESQWEPVNLEAMQVEVSAEAETFIFSLGLMPVQEDATATPEPEATESVEDGTPEATEEMFVDGAEDSVELPIILPQSGLAIAPAISWGLGFGLLVVVGLVLIMIGRRGGRS